MHKILLNSGLLSPIVSGGVRPKPPGQTPLYSLLPFVGRLGSGVRVQVSGLVSVFNKKYPPGSVPRCLRQQKTGLCVWGGFDLRLQRTCITSSPSQTLRRRLVQFVGRTPLRVLGSTLAAVRRGYIFHTSRLIWLITL